MVMLTYLYMLFLGDLGFLLFLLVLLFYVLNTLNTGLSYSDMFSLDLVGCLMFCLTVLVFFLMVLSGSFESLKDNLWKPFLFVCFFFLMALLLTFSVNSFLLFYFVFEVAVIPIFIMIISWGYSVNRSSSAMYMFLYTFVFSLPLLSFLLYLFNMGFLLSFSLVFVKNLFQFSSGIGFLLLIMVFLVKLPVFFLHLWLPKAHVDAPLLGSMVLAGVLLKLGGYGVFKSLLFLGDWTFVSLSWTGSFFMLGSFFMSAVCLRQVDLKSMVAYSSVAHMGSVLICFLSMKFYGVMGSYLVMVSHGFCSSVLFFLVNFFYMKFGSRSFLLNRGGLVLAPFFTYIWFFFCICNMGFPPTFCFFSEVYSLFSLLSVSYWLMMVFFLLMLFVGFYSVVLFIFYNHGFHKVFSSFLLVSLSDLVSCFFSLIFLLTYVSYMNYFCYFYLLCGSD